MDKVRRYLYSNLYLFLPAVLILVFISLLYALFENHWIRVSASTFSACDFSYGGGSRNLCENDILFSTFLSALGIATPLAFLLTAGLNRLLHIRWLSPLFGIALFFGIPFVFLLVQTVSTAGIYGELRGKINDTIGRLIHEETFNDSVTPTLLMSALGVSGAEEREVETLRHGLPS